MNGRTHTNEPDVTPSIISELPERLRTFLEMLVSMQPYLKGIKPLIISSHTLAQWFIYQKWNIELHQMNQYSHLFTTIETECYALFHRLLEDETMTWDRNDKHYAFEVREKDEINDRLILEFIPIKEKTG